MANGGDGFGLEQGRHLALARNGVGNGLTPFQKDALHKRSKEIRNEVLQMANHLVGNPKHFHLSNVIEIDVEVTKSDLKTIVSKNSENELFNVFKNTLAKDIEGALRSSNYEGWRYVKEGKHPEAAYFVYYGKENEVKAYICLRKMKYNGKFKPYAIVDERTFVNELGQMIKGMPPE